ncbi:MAG: hypothetical protein AB7V56_03400 [Candidatus Nitrosocosmicus sp.]|nr:hypothetical protein [Candidatus Nitrosocosmicus sp. SS]
MAASILLVFALVLTTYDQKGNFIVEGTFVDSSRNGSNDVSVYI